MNIILYCFIQVMDSFGRKPSGIMEGNFVWTGQHSQCVGINVPEWTGKYCYISDSIMWNNMTKFQFVSQYQINSG